MSKTIQQLLDKHAKDMGMHSFKDLVKHLHHTTVMVCVNAAAKEFEEQSKFIPVSDGLPEIGEKVLVLPYGIVLEYNEFGFEEIPLPKFTKTEHGEHFQSVIMPKVTHWQRRPKTPAGIEYVDVNSEDDNEPASN